MLDLLADAPLLHRGWQKWVASNLMNGVDPAKLVDRMVASGLDPDQSREEVDLALSSPAVEAGAEIVRGTRKPRALQRALAQMQMQNGAAQEVPRVDDPELFYRDYLWANRPVVVPGLMTDWPALSKWTPDFFVERFGNEIIEVTADRESDKFFEDNFLRHRRTMTMRDYIRAIESGGASNDLYLVAKNGLLTNPAFASLRDDFTTPASYLDTNCTAYDNARLWFGPGGTVRRSIMTAVTSSSARCAAARRSS
jgi:hypothetical protein